MARNILTIIFLLQDQDEYKWSDATYLSYFNWLRHQNMTSSEERCAVLDTDIFDCTDTCEYPDGNWVVTSCTETHPYLCKIKKGKFQLDQMI